MQSWFSHCYRALPLFLVGLVFAISPAEAHSAGTTLSGWSAGFNHPFHGWDHLLAMVAVGLWAAQQKGRAGWLIPVTFVTIMAMGGVVGAAGAFLRGVEAMILLSVIVFCGLALTRAKWSVGASMAIVALFAFFHGFAHGQELPGVASLTSFGLGFLLATALLHAMGYATARMAMALAVMIASCPAFAEEGAAPSPSNDNAAAGRVSEIIVLGRQDSLLGVASSATEGTVGADELSARPLLRAGEVLETVPGVIITQHAGGGKANQYFTRGFNLDHGTDFATSIDGMPVNLPSHGHGQGYSDLNFLIPELIQRVNYDKGVYAAQNGDFSSAGAVHLEQFKTLPGDMAVIEGGMFGYGRLMAAGSREIGENSLLAALEVSHEDGPWVKPDNYWKYNGVLTYSGGDSSGGYSLSARGYHGQWNSSDQVAASAVTTGLIPLYGSLDPTDGGASQRYSLQGEWHADHGTSRTNVSAYAFYYDLNLFSDFTYFLVDPVHGDQFEQRDKRITTGLQANQTVFGDWFGKSVESTIGLQFRNDNIHNGLYQTEARQRVDKIDVEDGAVIPAVTRQDGILENSIGLYVENKIQWSPHFRTVAGLREDIFFFDVNSNRPENSGNEAAAKTSPKLSLIFGPWASTEVYLQGGLGFHSNDARGVVTHVDPITGRALDSDGNPIKPANPLVRSVGADLGIRTTAIPNLQTTFSLWWLDLDSELVFSGDGGATEPSRPSRRYGIEFANYYTPANWLTFDLDVSLSQGRFRDNNPVGNRIPESIQSVVAGGITVRNYDGFFGSLRLRYFGPRPLIEDDSFRSGATVILNGQVGYQFSDRWTAAVDVLNLLNRHDHDIDYAYESRVTSASQMVMQDHFHPVEPRQVRLSLKARY